MSLTLRDGELHVDVAAWTAMIGAAPSPGAVDAARQVPGGERALAAVAHPLAVLQLETATPGGVRNHEVWLGSDAAALLVHTADGTDRHVVPLPHDQVTAALARLTGLGPRDRMRDDIPRHPRDVADEVLAGWFALDADVRRSALAPFGADRAWRLVAHAVGSTEEPLVLVVADGSDGGAWLVELADQAFVAAPVSPTVLFRQLAAVLPLLGRDVESVTGR
ncbi:hypothetical protein [Nocardioides sp. CER19]|uniref:hypothetical protein n=1 Tax=Nocardioides sp. CER19 TaxID=3038538 RepID=UPI0024486ABA|nr:hypothetical protein [Nocardioides sp. CER19]MDH2414578.1 hypothetical protein [Nocardioides sp. CER19]